MIIDSHTHIYPDSIAQRAIKTVIDKTNGLLTAHTDGTYAGLLKSVTEAGIEYAIVQMIATNPNQGESIYKWIQTLIHQSEKIKFYASVHPKDPQYKLLVKKFKDMGVKGIKLHAPYQDFNVDSKEIYPLYEEILNNNMIIHFHAGLDRSNPQSDSASVERFSRMLKDFDGCKIVLAHGGGDGEWNKVVELLSERTCYFDTSFILDEILADEWGQKLLKSKADYFLFGSDSPWKSQKKYIELLNSSPLFTQEQKQNIFSHNLLKLLNH